MQIAPWLKQLEAWVFVWEIEQLSRHSLYKRRVVTLFTVTTRPLVAK